jgi:hypothetical protein
VIALSPRFARVAADPLLCAAVPVRLHAPLAPSHDDPGPPDSLGDADLP